MDTTVRNKLENKKLKTNNIVQDINVNYNENITMQEKSI